MFQKIILISSLCCCLQAQSQTVVENDETVDNSISAQLYTKCFENLNQGAEILEKYPAWKEAKLCSLLYCMALLGFQDKEAQIIGEARLIGIATQLFREGNPVYLISGMESSLEAQKKNKNLEDDNHIVYINYAACTSPIFLTKAAEIVNKQTMTLIYQNKSN